MMNTPLNSLSLLTIGNSFSDSLKAYFPQVVESAGCELHLEAASHGGCELHRHWEYISNEERDGVYVMYQNHTKHLRDILASRPWDVVTIQQASHASWRRETYQPFANNICNYIHHYAPASEICIQQTWAYRLDDPRIMPGGAWGIDQDEMYRRLTENYRAVAAELGGLRIIPTGYAVQLARQQQPHAFVNYPPELLQTMTWPDLPDQAWALVGKMRWVKSIETGEMFIHRDTIHLNQRGEYLQACVWFAKLYHRPVSDITFIPDCIGDKDAAFLRGIAQQAVDSFKEQE
ncbi:MAG: DUF4886 domain-containing protein [Victivallales bacterium]|nr:DUF4886 domain-containing protein [Victivallales bacterium]